MNQSVLRTLVNRLLQPSSAAFSTLEHRASSYAAAAVGRPFTSGQHSRHTADSSSSSWAAAGAALAALAATITAAVSADSHKSPSNASVRDSAASPAIDGVPGTGGVKLLSLPIRQRIFFRYEKRIRDLSTLEKIFDYFATHEKDGGKVMNSQDVVRALVPTYPPVGTDVERAGFLDGEHVHSPEVKSAAKHLLHFFDHNDDGTISFQEFVLIVIALAVPEKDVDIVFDIIDLDNNGVLTEEEFKQALQQLERRAGIQASFHGRAGRHNTVDNDRDMAHRLFQDNERGVPVHKFRAFLQRLQHNVLKLEFAHYDTKDQGYICGADFAHSLVTAADAREVEKYLDLVDEMPAELANAQISFKDFSSMAHLRQHLYMLSFALDFCYQIQRPVPRMEFVKIVKKSLNMKISPTVLDIIYYCFGDDEGNLDGPAFVDVMKRRNRVPGYKVTKVSCHNYCLPACLLVCCLAFLCA
eukprot:GHUV01025765.1.p1 GENE.GHUV01025765.1~~GHUV01025765.1.p1  ORF type:complete len:470 (+),score=125.94 GHUV01025765.1:256-1665(+)